jgi:putative DNA primase/helicase
MQGSKAAEGSYLDPSAEAISRLSGAIDLIDFAEDDDQRATFWRDLRAEVWPSILPALCASAAAAEPVIARLGLVAGRGWEARARDLRAELRRAAKVAGAGLRVVPGGGGEDRIDAWRLKLDGSKTARSAVLILENAEEWSGRARFDEFRGVSLWDEKPLSDTELTEIQIGLDEGFGVEFSIDTVARAVAAVAARNPINMLQDARSACKWDGIPRVNALFPSYLGADDNALTQAAGRILCLSAIARAFDPGCKADNVVILVGAQGVRKSSAMRALAGPAFYSDSEFDPGSRDGFAALRGVNVFELAEFDKWNNRRDAALIKAFITSQRDRYRPAYARFEVNQPRTCVFVGTTNVDEVLLDATGDRRFLPVRVAVGGQPIDVDRLERDAPQIWAEALARFRAGERWHVSADVAELQAADAERWRPIDPWADHIRIWLDRPDGHAEAPTTAQILESACGLPRAQASTGYVRRVNAIMRGLGWISRRPAYGSQDRSPRWFCDVP